LKEHKTYEGGRPKVLVQVGNKGHLGTRKKKKNVRTRTYEDLASW